MTDKQIIKAFKCITYGEIDKCLRCPYDVYKECETFVYEDALDLINRQQAEIERLKVEKDNLIKTYAECQVDFLKEFVKKLKEDIRYRVDETGDYELYEVFQDIDNLVEEMGCGNGKS